MKNTYSRVFRAGSIRRDGIYRNDWLNPTGSIELMHISDFHWVQNGKLHYLYSDGQTYIMFYSKNEARWPRRQITKRLYS